MDAPARMTLTEYAQRRGVSKMAVSKAVSSGRLVQSVTRDENGRPWVLDAELADREWTRNTNTAQAPVYVRVREEQAAAALVSEEPPPPVVRDPSRGGRPPKARAPEAPAGESPRPPTDGPPTAVLGASLTENNAAKAYWQARQAELDYRRDAGELVEASEVRGAVEEAFRRCRGRLLALPSRLAQQLPELGAAGASVAERLVREALEDLAAEAVTR